MTDTIPRCDDPGDRNYCEDPDCPTDEDIDAEMFENRMARDGDGLTETEREADRNAQESRAQMRVPKPGDADYDWSPHYDTADLYTHTFADGTVVAIRSMAAINNKTWLYKMRDVKSDGQFVVLAISRASCEAADRLLMSLDDTDGDPIDELWSAWLTAGTGRGEGDEGLTAGN